MTPKFDLFSKGMPAATSEGSTGFRGMASTRHGQKEERARHAELIEQLREALKPFAISTADQRKLSNLAQSAEGEFFWREVLSLGQEFKRQQQPDKAGTVFAFVAKSSPEAFQEPANHELNAILGQGHVGLRSEFLVSSFVQNATDYRTIVPMLAGSIVGQSISAATMGRLASARSATFFTRGIGARSLAGIAGLTAEIPVFAFSNRALAGSASPVGDDLARAALTLSALKVFGGAGNRMVGSRFISPAANGAVRAVVPQVSMFFGLMAAHKLEERAGLRPHVDGATTVTDTLASLVSLGVGAHLGHQFLGSKFAAFQKEMALRVDPAGKVSSDRDSISKLVDRAFGPASAQKAVDSLVPSHGPRNGIKGLSGARIKPFWHNPVLAPLWAMMSAGGIGGPPGGENSRSLGEVGAGLIPETHKESLHYHGLDLELETTVSRPQTHIGRTAEFMRDALLDILTNGEEDGTMLSGKVAEQLRNDGTIRAMANRHGNRVKVRFDGEAQSILEVLISNPATGLKLELKDPALVATQSAEFQPERPSGIQSTSSGEPASPLLEGQASEPELEGRDCGLVVAAVAPESVPVYPSNPTPANETFSEESQAPATPASPSTPAAASPASERPPSSRPPSSASGVEAYQYQFRIAESLEMLAQAGGEWTAIRDRAALFFQRMNRPAVTGPMILERNIAGANLHYILASRDRGFASTQITELLTAFEQALDGEISQRDVYRRRQTMTADSWRRLAEVAAASALPEEKDSQEENPFTGPPPVRPSETPELLGLKKLEFLSQTKPAWRQVYFEAQAIYERIFSAEEGGVAKAFEEARDHFHDVLFEVIDVIEENGRVTPPKVMKLLDAFEKAMKGEMSWEEFKFYDYKISTPPPPSPAVLLSKPAPEIGESDEVEVATEPPNTRTKKNEPKVEPPIITTENIEPNVEPTPAGTRAGTPAREALTRLDPATLSELQQAIWDVVLKASGEVQGKYVIQALSGRSENFKTVYSNLARMAELGYLSVRSQAHPNNPNFPPYKFYSVPETVRRTIGLSPLQRRVMEFFLNSERTEFLGAKAVRYLEKNNYHTGNSRSVYGALMALEKKGLLSSRVEANEREGMPDLRYYRLPEVKSTPSVLQSIVLSEKVAALVKGAPLQELVYRILHMYGGEMQVSEIAECVRLSNEWEGKAESTGLALRVLEKKGVLTSRTEPNPAKGLPPLRFYTLAVEETPDDVAHLQYSTWEHIHQRADQFRQSEIEGRFEGRRLEQAREALRLVFKYEKDLAPEQGELLLRVFEGDLASGGSFQSVKSLLEKMLPFKKILHKLKRLHEMGDPWREVSAEASQRFNALFNSLVANAKREAGVRALKEIISTVGQLAPGDILDQLRGGQIEEKMEAAPSSPVPPRPVMATEPPPPAPVMFPAHLAKNWGLTIEPNLERSSDLLRDPRMSRALGVLRLGELLIEEINRSHVEKSGRATTQDQFEWSQSLSEFLNQALVQEKSELILIEEQMIELMQDIRTIRFGEENGSAAAEVLRRQGLGSKPARPITVLERPADTAVETQPQSDEAAPPVDPVVTPAVLPESDTVSIEDTLVSNHFVVEAPVEAPPPSVDPVVPHSSPAPVAATPKHTTLNPPKPAPVQEVIELAPEPGQHHGLFGLGRAFSFFAVPMTTHPDGKEFEASLILPNLHRLTFPVLVQSSGSLQVKSETGKAVSNPGGREYAFEVKKVEGYEGLVRINMGKDQAPFDLQISPVRDRSNNIQRLILAPIQAPYAGNLQPFFANSAPRPIRVQVLHHDLLVTGSRKGEYRTRYGFYLSNGDTMELGLNYALHGSGKFRVTSAHLTRLGLDPEKPLELDVLKGSGSGGKNRVVVGHKDAGFHLEMDTDIPSISAGGAIPIFKNFQVKSAPLPVWVRLKSAPDKGEEKSILQKNDSEEVGVSSDRNSSVPPSHPTAYDEIRDLSMKAMGGEAGAIARLGELGRKDSLALQELTELFDIAQTEGATAEELGGVEPSEYRRLVLHAIGEAAKENPRGLIHLTALHSAGILTSLEPIFAVADGESAQSGEARQYLLNQSQFGQVEVLSGLIAAAKDSQTPAWKDAVNRHMRAYYLGEASGGPGLRHRMVRELAVVKIIQGLAALGHSEAKESLRSLNDFREYKSQFEKGTNPNEILTTLREVAKTNPRAAKFLRELETGSPRPPASPPTPPSSSPITAEEEESFPEALASEEMRAYESPAAADPMSPAAEEAKRTMAHAHSLSFKKVFRGDLFKKMGELATQLTPAEKRELLEQWTPHLIAALKDKHQKKMILFFDAIGALDQDLEPETREWLVSQLKPWEGRVPKNMETALHGILTGKRAEVYVRYAISSEAIIPIRTDLVLNRTNGESGNIAKFKDLLDRIHHSRKDKEQDALYLELNSIGTSLNSDDLHRMAEEATDELVLAAQQAFLAINLDGNVPKYSFQSKIAVLANVLFRIFRAMKNGEDAQYYLTLLQEPNLRRFRIDWLFPKG